MIRYNVDRHYISANSRPTTGGQIQMRIVRIRPEGIMCEAHETIAARLEKCEKDKAK